MLAHTVQERITQVEKFLKNSEEFNSSIFLTRQNNAETDLWPFSELWMALSVSRLFLQPCVIADCGEHKDGDSWGAAPNDGSGDTHPDFPEDSDINLKDVSIGQVFDLQGHGWTLADQTALRVSAEGPLRVFRKCACLSSYLKAEKTHIHFRTRSQDMFNLANTSNRVNLLLNKFKG